ncbi:hypothetical protein JZX86_05770 [Agrobacterium rosae]|uniref:DUF6197 family protein n=1 Tax=Agrobacterium rosae TaxID=1972867 RepID=UPI0019D371F6|nr:hypothetical protein [Agrobacterium rosae]MBN7804871.1 hypothetical protein [Agrobacterium rosae]
MTDTVQILRDARALIADEKNWTQGDYAKNSFGHSTGVKNENANCFCAIGALAKVQGISPNDDITGASFLALEASGGAEKLGFIVARFNDDHTHAEVIALFDRAIARAESEAVQ